MRYFIKLEVELCDTGSVKYAANKESFLEQAALLSISKEYNVKKANVLGQIYTEQEFLDAFASNLIDTYRGEQVEFKEFHGYLVQDNIEDCRWFTCTRNEDMDSNPFVQINAFESYFQYCQSYEIPDAGGGVTMYNKRQFKKLEREDRGYSSCLTQGQFALDLIKM